MLTEELRSELMGAGAPFELAVDAVSGAAMTVFARRPTSLIQVLATAADDQPDDIYLVEGERTWTYSEALTQSRAIAARLIDTHGIRRGDRVAVVAANTAEHALAIWGIVAAGGIVTSLNAWWVTRELEYGITLTSPSLILGDERRLARLDGSHVAARIPTVPLQELVASASAGPSETDAAVPGGPNAEDDPAVILFTSGTTGRPKGATLSHRNLVHFCVASQLSSAIGEALMPAAETPRRPAIILSSPLFHVSGLINLVMSGATLGTKLVLPPVGRWDETTYLDLTVQHQITTWSGVPTHYLRLLRHPGIDAYDLSCVARIGSGGAPFPPQLVRDIEARLPGVTIGNGFGMTETAGFGTIAAGPLVNLAPDSVGMPQPGCEVEIRRSDGTLAQQDEVGEIHLRSPSVFLGYWDDPEATAACIDTDRWYRTGDYGRLSNGLLYLDSRRRDLILRGGENVYPIEIEHRLVEHPEIDDAAVIGIDHDLLGQEVVAIVVRSDGSSVSAHELTAWVGDALARFKVPSRIEFRDKLPYTDTGKVLKRELEVEFERV